MLIDQRYQPAVNPRERTVNPDSSPFNTQGEIVFFPDKFQSAGTEGSPIKPDDTKEQINNTQNDQQIPG